MAKEKTVQVMEFSKKMLVWSYIVGIATILFAMIIQCIFIAKDYQGDSSIVIALLSGGFAEMSIVSGVYAVKAKMENRIKLEAIYKTKIDDNEDDYS